MYFSMKGLEGVEVSGIDGYFPSTFLASVVYRCTFTVCYVDGIEGPHTQ